MALTEIIKDCIHLGMSVKFSLEINNLSIKLETDSIKKESWLPLFDHCYEAKIIDCIKYMQIKLIEELEQK